METATMRHLELGDITVPVSAIPFHAAAGWVVVVDDPAPADDKPTDPDDADDDNTPARRRTSKPKETN